MSDPETWAATPRGGSKFAELNDQPRSPNQEFRDNGSRVVRTIFVPYADITIIPYEYLMIPSVQTSGATRYISRFVPDGHPDWTNLGNRKFLFATQILSMEGHALPDRNADGDRLTKSFKNTPIYRYAKTQILYESLPYRVLPDEEILNGAGIPDEALLKRYVSFRTQTTTENLTLPKESFKGVVIPGDADPLPVPGFAGIRISTTNLTITWHRVPEEALGIKSLMVDPPPPSYPVDAARGCLNSITFANWRPGTLLFLGENATPCESALGDRLYDVQYDYKGMDMGDDANGNPIGHASLLFRDAKWRELTKTGLTTNFGTFANDVNPFNWADFHTLFRPPVPPP